MQELADSVGEASLAARLRGQAVRLRSRPAPPRDVRQQARASPCELPGLPPPPKAPIGLAEVERLPWRGLGDRADRLHSPDAVAERGDRAVAEVEQLARRDVQDPKRGPGAANRPEHE